MSLDGITDVPAGRRIVRMGVGLGMWVAPPPPALGSRPPSALVGNWTLAASEAAPFAVSFVLALQNATLFSGGAGGGTAALPLPPHQPYGVTLLARASNGSTRVVAGPTVVSATGTRPRAAFPLLPARRAALGLALWFDFSLARPSVDAAGNNVGVSYVPDLSNPAAPYAGVQPDGGLRPKLYDWSQGDASCYFAYANSALPVPEAAAKPFRNETLSMACGPGAAPGDAGGAFILAVASSFYSLSGDDAFTLLSKGDSTNAPGWEIGAVGACRGWE